MNPFEFTSVARIIFGRGKIAQLGELARGLGSTVLMIHNGDDPGRGGPVDRAAASLAAANLPVFFHRQRGEPTVADIDAALSAARENHCDLLIGLGGGSAIDAAKATAGLLTNGGACLDYMEVIGKGQRITKLAAPWIAIPTTAGTGAEVTKNAVIGSPEHKFKASIRGELLLVRVALIDPELHVGVPPEVTAASGMDALCQLIEAYTSTNANPMTDAICERGIELAPALLRAYGDGGDVDSRERLALAALWSGIALTNAGLGAVHGFAAPIGANFPIPHGVICARLLAPVIAANTQTLRTQSPDHEVLGKYESFGVYDGKNVPGPSNLGELARAFSDEMHIPRLGAYGFREEDIPEMVSLAKKSSSMRYNPVVLADDVLANILRSAL
jgi:alcohol dehydrogenase class IV